MLRQVMLVLALSSPSTNVTEPALLSLPRLSTALIASISVASAASVPALAAGPFESFNGNWSGTGTVYSQSGSPERIRCNANYRPQGGSDLTVRLRCASDSYNFDLSGQISTDGSSLRGQWNENSRGVGGSVEGTVRGDRMQVHIDTAGFSAVLGITTRGRRQDVSMDSRGGGQIVRGSISMSRH
jgi:hypothetical protein